METIRETCKRFRVIILYLIIIFFPMTYFVALIHETGHLIVADCFHFQVIAFVVNWFPFSIEDSHVNVLIPYNVQNWQLAIFYMGGSFFTLIFGIFCFILFYKKKLNPFVELLLFVYFLALTLEFFIYNLLDVNFFQMGDWYNIYLLYPQINGFFLFGGILFSVLLVRYFKTIIDHVDVCW